MKRTYFLILFLLQPYTYVTIESLASSNRNSNYSQYQSVDKPSIFAKNILLSTDDSNWVHHVEPAMALGDNDELFVGWKNAIEHDGGGKSVAFTYSIDGENWEDPKDMDPFWSTGSIQSDPWMVFFNHTLYYSYLEAPTGAQGQGQITFTYTNDSGATWTKVRGTYGTGVYADKETFAIGNDGTIYLVYSDVYSSDDTYTWIKLSRSFDGGNSFIENVTISDNEAINIGAYVLPSISGELHVLWTHYSWGDTAAPNPDESSIIYDKSTDNGNTFKKDTDFIPEYNATWSERNPENNRSAKHTLAVMEQDPNTGRIYATWADISANKTNSSHGWDVYFRYSDDNGLSWSSIRKVNEEDKFNQWNPDMELDSQGNLHFIYYDESSAEGRNLMHRIFYPESNEFSSESQVNTVPSSPEFTRPGEYNSIRIDSNDTPHIVWTDTRNNELDIYYSNGEFTEAQTTTTSKPTTSLEILGVMLGLGIVLVIRRHKRKKIEKRCLLSFQIRG
ncbi:MAG: sialidase family protein [Candidatus Hodarchaeales archaeon]|jgi:hypothetical protein